MPNDSGSPPNTKDFLVLPIAPIPPPSGVIRFYAGPDGKLAAIDSSGNAALGGGITSVASLPATCTPGVTAPVQLSVSPFGVYTCSATNTWTADSSPPGVISPSTYGVKMDGKMCRDGAARFTTTTSVTCTDGTFTAADVGKIIFGTCCGLQGGNQHPLSSVLLPQGTITAFNSPTNVTVSIAGTSAACAAGATGCLLIWGSDDSTAWDNTWTAATGTPGHCSTILMGAGLTLIQSAKFLSTVCNTGITGPGSQGSTINGMGYKTSQFVITPNFNAASCTGTGSGATSNVCFGPGKGFQFMNMGIWGGENGTRRDLDGKVFVDVGIDSYLINVLFAGLACGNGGNMIGVQLEASGQTMFTMILDGFGGGGGAGNPSLFVIGGNYNSCVFCFVGNNSGPSIQINAGVIFSSFGGAWGGQSTSTLGVVINNGTFDSYHDTWFGTSAAGGADIVVGANSLTYLNGGQVINTNAAADIALFFNSATAKVYARNTTFQGGSANHDITVGTMGTFFDQGGNIFVTGLGAGTIVPTCTFTSGGGTSPSCALQAGSTNEKGTIIASTGTGAPGTTGTITLTFAGTFAGASNTTPSCTFTINDSGTAWGNGALAKVSTQSTTAPIVAWSNSVANVLTALTVSSPYRIDYVCVAR